MFLFIILNRCIKVYCLKHVFSDLKKERDLLIYQALAPSTRKVYSTHVQKFRMFCKHIGSQLPKGYSDESVELWLTHLKNEGAAYSTIRSHLSAVKQYCLQKEIPSRMDSPRVILVLKGIRRNQEKSSKIKEVVKLSDLRRLILASKKLFGDGFKHRQFAAMASLAFFAFLRPSEYCVSSAAHELKWEDVKVGSKLQSLKITLPSYKHSKGAGMVLVKAQGTLSCPVSCFLAYRNVSKFVKNKPWF